MCRPVTGLAHIGIRVHELERSVRFYELLGFTKTAGSIGPEPVAILVGVPHVDVDHRPVVGAIDHPSGVELN